MRKLFDGWTYIFKNLWFVLPFAVMPAVFLALSLDFSAIDKLVYGFFTGKLDLDFVDYFRAWSFLRIDSILGAIYSVVAFACIVVFTALMLTFVEKHMRIGKRSLSGGYAGFVNILLPVLLVAFVYTCLYELWAVILSALLFVVSRIQATALVYILFIAVFLLLTYALLYCVTAFYLWLPCRQMTGFGLYHAFVYSYRLMTNVRWQLILSYLLSITAGFLLIGGFAFLPEPVFRIVAVLLFILLYLSFCIRMETTYFATDKLDREDLIHSYRGY